MLYSVHPNKPPPSIFFVWHSPHSQPQETLVASYVQASTTPIQLPGQTCKSVIISAKRVIAGLSGGASSNNSDILLIGVGAAPSGVTAYTGIPLAPGETIEFNVADASMIYIAGAASDVANVCVLN